MNLKPENGAPIRPMPHAPRHSGLRGFLKRLFSTGRLPILFGCGCIAGTLEAGLGEEKPGGKAAAPDSATEHHAPQEKP